MRPAVKRYIISKPKLRQSWNKFNLYNLSKYAATIPRARKTFFQQKWQAKQALRAYHGEHIGEKRWTRLFSRRLMGAVEMPPQYLAAHDGSEQATGRGSGRQIDPNDLNARPTVTASDFSQIEQIRLAKEKQEESLENNNRLTWPSHAARNRQTRDRPGALLAKPISKMTPYMHMTFAPMERRLDIAMFRAMFASSPRQARQFCIHGGVKVNGKKMRYGAYLLNPGDMFQVDPDKVMYATGRLKPRQQALHNPVRKAKKEGEEAEEGGEEAAETAETPTEEQATKKPAEAASADVPTPVKKKPVISDSQEFFILRRLLQSAQALQNNSNLPAKDKRQLRNFLKESRRSIRSTSKDQSEDDLIAELSAHIGRFNIHDNELIKINSEITPKTAEYFAPSFSPFEKLLPDTRKRAERLARENKLSLDEQKTLSEMLFQAEKNPYDPSKPYKTPWEPRRYLAPFAFIPRYLEVNQNICSAIYLRHPVARRGMTEVPTPFPYEFSQLAFNWYLRRS